MLPPGDLIETRFTDSLGFEFRTLVLDTATTYNTDQQLVGNYIDPVFGRINAETYMQVFSRTQPVIGSEDLIYDSLLLKLEFAGAYGRQDDPLSLSIYEITESWPTSESLTNEARLEASSSRIGGPVPLQLSEEGNLQLSIRLSDELGRRLLYASPDVLGDRDRFRDLFKGLLLTTEPVKQFKREPGAIFRLLAASNNTQLELHYREEDDNSTAFRTKIEPFQITGSTPRFHHVSRRETEGTLLSESVSTPEDTLKQFEFLQGVLQLRNFIRIDDPSTLGRVSINQAELTLKVVPNTLGANDVYPPPVSILPLAADAEGQLAFDAEGRVDPITVSRGFAAYDATRGTYSIDLTRYLQEILTGQRENHGFILLPNGTSSRIDRAVMGGLAHPSLAPELVVTYSTLPE